MSQGWQHRIAREALCVLVRLLVGAYRSGPLPTGPAQLYFANHCSHLDTLTVLAALPAEARQRTRPVAAQDYWCATPLRRWIAEKVLNVVYISRTVQAGQDPMAAVHAALEEGASVIFFPEGTRQASAQPRAFKGGLYRLAVAHPEVELVPVYLENLYRILPKGSSLPVPLINKVHLGPVLERQAAESKPTFLLRAHASVCALAPTHAKGAP